MELSSITSVSSYGEEMLHCMAVSVCVHVSGSEIIVVGLVSGEDILADLNELYEGECGVPCKCVS